MCYLLNCNEISSVKKVILPVKYVFLEQNRESNFAP